VLTLGAKICAADGEINTAELETFRRHFGITSENFPASAAVFNEALNSNERPEVIAKRIKDQISGELDLLRFVLLGLARVAIADGHYHLREHAILTAVAKGFGFTSDDLEHILALIGVTPNFSEQSERKEPNVEEFYLRILGLKVGATAKEIRIAYRTLARRHHPDHLFANGVPLEEVKRSEEILKTINNAYDWLIKHQQVA
jgi:DnaJ-domain-containing protein 1